MRYAAGAPDPFVIARLDAQPSSLDGRTQVVGRVDPLETTAVIIIEGQSNGANFHRGAYSVTQSRNHNFNIYNGGVYATKNPMFSCNGFAAGTGDDSCFAARLGDKLIASGLWQRIIMIPIGRGGSASADWSNGLCTERIIATAKWCALRGLTPTMILRHQGEQDAVNGYTAATVAAQHRTWAAVWRAYGVTCPIFIAKVSISNTIIVTDPVAVAVRLGQTNALSSSLGIYAGPDSDAIAHRYDGVHMDATGSDLLADAFKTVIDAFF